MALQMFENLVPSIVLFRYGQVIRCRCRIFNFKCSHESSCARSYATFVAIRKCERSVKVKGMCLSVLLSIVLDFSYEI